jgi:hypothetical protein
MITTIAGIAGAALLFGLFSLFRPRDKSCSGGGCIGCIGDGACERKGAKS